MNIHPSRPRLFVAAVLFLLGLLLLLPAKAAETRLNVRDEVLRNGHQDLNPAFVAAWKQRSGGELSIDPPHGGSSKQARSVINGLQAPTRARNMIRSVDPAVLGPFVASSPALQVFTVEEAFGSRPSAQAAHFVDGGRFDPGYASR